MSVTVNKVLRTNLIPICLCLVAIATIGIVILVSIADVAVYGLLALFVLAGIVLFFFKRPIRALMAFILLLPIHSFVLTILIAQVHLPLSLVKVIAAWKESLLVGTFVVVTSQVLLQKRPLRLIWVDSVAFMWFILVVYYFLFHDLVFQWESNLILRLYGARDWLLYLLPYFIGRLVFVSTRNTERIIKAIVLVGVLTSLFGIIEVLFIPTEWHVTLGVPRYFADFLNLSYPEHYQGLPFNYWTSIRGYEIRRAVSTYLSGQGFAIPFLLIIPVVTYNYLAKLTRSALLSLIICWLALLLTITRMTITVCFIQSMITLWIFGRKRLFILILLFALSIFVTALLSNQTFRNYVVDTVTFQDDSGRTRPGQWLTGVQALIESPLGSGLGSVGDVGARFGTSGVGTEAGYFKLTGALGLLGLILFLSWFLGIASCAFFAYRKQKDVSGGLAGIILIVVIGFLLNNLTAPPDQSTFVIYIFGWLAGLAVQQAVRLSTWHHASLQSVSYRDQASG